MEPQPEKDLPGQDATPKENEISNEELEALLSQADAVASGKPLEEAISNDELAALGITVDPPPAAAPKAAEVMGDSVSADELAALLGEAPPPPRAAPPPTPPPAAPSPPPAQPQPKLPELVPEEEISGTDSGMGLLMDVPLRVSIELGRISMTLQQVLGLGRGSIVELDRLAGEPVDILVNDKPIGRGEVVVVDEYFGVKITELIEPKG